MGHSAGAHLVMLAAQWLHLHPDWMPDVRRETIKGIVGCVCTSALRRGAVPQAYDRIRSVNGCAIRLAGVYDIPEHYEFEAWRGVEEVSGMGRAMGTVRMANASAWHT